MQGFCVRTLLGLTVCAVLGHASTIYTITAANGATAEAYFTFGADSLVLKLMDTSVNPGDVAFNLSALSFTFAGGTGGALTGASAGLITVNGNKTYSGAGSASSVANVGWVFSTPAANTYQIDDLVGTGHAGPAHTIIGAPAADDKYDAANGSIKGNGPHNPFLDQSAEFVFNFTGGVNESTLLSGVSFQFGTLNGTWLSGACQSGCQPEPPPPPEVPEPGTYALLGSGLCLLGASRKYFTRG